MLLLYENCLWIIESKFETINHDFQNHQWRSPKSLLVSRLILFSGILRSMGYLILKSKYILRNILPSITGSLGIIFYHKGKVMSFSRIKQMVFFTLLAVRMKYGRKQCITNVRNLAIWMIFLSGSGRILCTSSQDEDQIW